MSISDIFGDDAISKCSYTLHCSLRAYMIVNRMFMTIFKAFYEVSSAALSLLIFE